MMFCFRFFITWMCVSAIGIPFLGNVSGLAHRDARCDEEAACSADYDEAGGHQPARHL